MKYFTVNKSEGQRDVSCSLKAKRCVRGVSVPLHALKIC